MVGPDAAFRERWVFQAAFSSSRPASGRRTGNGPAIAAPWGHHHFLHDFPHFTGSCAFWRRGREKTETPRNTLEMAAWESVRVLGDSVGLVDDLVSLHELLTCRPRRTERQRELSSTSGQATLEDWLTRIDLIEIEVNESNTFRPHTAFLYRRSVGTHMAPDTDGSRRGDGARLRRARGPAGRSAPSATGHEPSAARPEAVHLSPPQARSTMTAPRPIVRKA